MAEILQQAERRAAQRAMWALGDYHQIGLLLAGFGPDLVDACGIRAGQRVLDVGAGSGNVAIAAAAAGADVAATDLTPELFDAGRRAAAEAGVTLQWVEAPAEQLPFGDDEFDVVTSAVGAIFASDHQRVADELVRVCRPNGVIGMINWPVDGFSAEFFSVFAEYAPPPPGAPSPLQWGIDDHVRELFGDRVRSLEISRQALTIDHFDTPEQLCELYQATFPPTVATYAAIAHDPDQVAALDHDFLDFARRRNLGQPGGPARYEYSYVRVIAVVG